MWRDHSLELARRGKKRVNKTWSFMFAGVFKLDVSNATAVVISLLWERFRIQAKLKDT